MLSGGIMMKKTLALCMALLLAALTLAGCSKEKTYDSIYDKIMDTKEMHVALSPDFAPMEFVDTSKTGQDQYVGFDVTLAKYIADKLGVKLVIEPMSFEACQAAVSTKDVDLSISGYSRTPQREANFELSDGYYTNNESNQVIIMLKENAPNYTKPSDFDGKLISAQNASLQYNLLTEQLPNAQANLITDLGVAILEVINGQVDGLACAKGQAEIFKASHSELDICPWEFEITDDANVVMIAKGETKLLEAINKILAECLEKGLYAGWYEEANNLAMSEFAKEVSIED
jgi:polar amino acid transport system substrate-binding protein